MAEKSKIKLIKILLLVFMVFVVYNTLIPFKMYLSATELIRGLGLIDWTPYFHNGRFNSITDVVGNVILFIPFGFLLYMLQAPTGKTALILRVAALGFLFSLSIELIQILFKYRITSVTDLCNNTLGAFAGAVAAKIYLSKFERSVQKNWNLILKNEPLSLLILTIVAVQIFSSALPFNVSITISDLKKSVAYCNIMPFGMQPLGLFLGAHVKKISDLTFSWTEFAGNVLFYMMYGYMVWYAFYSYWRNRQYGILKVAALLVVFFPAIEMLQFIIKSRFSDINDIISGYFGAGLGTVLFFALKKDYWFKNNLTIKPEHFQFIILIYFIYIVYKGLSPFDFSADPEVMALNLNLKSLVPFYAYFKVTSLWNIYDLLETFFMTMPIGILLAVQNKLQQPFYKALLIGLIIGLIVEISQVFLPARSGEITDVLVMAVGAAAGVKFYAYFKEKQKPETDFVQSLQQDGFDPDAIFE